MSVQVFCEYERAQTFCAETKSVVEYVLSKEARNADVSVIFVSDERMLQLNREFLGHDYVTDVISFPLEENDGSIEGEIYVAVDQARRQAEEYNVSVENEVTRLVIHGVLHLLGYDDTTPEGRSEMKKKEDAYVASCDISFSQR